MDLTSFASIILTLIVCTSGSHKIYNVDLIIDHVNSLNTTWTAGHNLGKDVTLEYFKLLLSSKTKLKGSLLPIKHVEWDGPIPEQFDSRENWPKCEYIGHIRDQGACASGWAIAAASSFSDRYCIASQGNFSKPFSSNYLLACCSKCGEGCNGGFDLEAWTFFKNIGVVTGGDYHSHSGCQPYQINPCDHNMKNSLDLPKCSDSKKSDTPQCQSVCINKHYPISFAADHRKIKSISFINQTELIQKEILKNGPVQAGFIVYEDFPLYKSGVYKQTTGDPLGGHSVRIIGWGTDKSKNVPYWLVANSWNTNWGDKGLFKILRGTNECGIEDEVIAGEPQL